MVNKVTLIGRLGKDPEFRVTAGGTPMAKFSLATSEKRKNPNGEVVETTEWHRLTCWSRQAEVARDYLAKGQLLYVEGRIHYDSYENKEGVKVYTTDIVVSNFQMLSGKGEGSSAGGSESSGGGAGHSTTKGESAGGRVESGGFEDDDLPF
jgi:single-strand DNA-binding protein